MKKTIIALTAVATALSLNATEGVAKAEVNTAFQEFDKLNNEINIWTKKGELEAAKKGALADELENVQLNKAIDHLKSGTSFVTDDTGDDQEVSSLYSQDPFMSKDNSGSTSMNQEDILSANGVEHNAGEDIDKKINKLEVKQDEFFKQIQEYVNGVEKRQAQMIEKQEQDHQDENYDELKKDSVDYFSDSKNNSSDNFEYDPDNILYGAKVKGVTPSKIELIFNVYYQDEDVNIYIVKSFSKDEKSFELVLENNKAIPVRILSIDGRVVRMKVEDQVIVAR